MFTARLMDVYSKAVVLQDMDSTMEPASTRERQRLLGAVSRSIKAFPFTEPVYRLIATVIFTEARFQITPPTARSSWEAVLQSAGPLILERLRLTLHFKWPCRATLQRQQLLRDL
jgi:hypothetical protein